MLSENIHGLTPHVCPECNGSLISIIERGETVCCQCGLILNERNMINNTPVAYNSEQIRKKYRTGTPINPLLPDLGLCVTYSTKTQNPNLRRAIKLNRYIPWDKKNLLIAMTELNRLCHNLNIPEYIKRAAFNLYKEALKKNLIKGRTIVGMVSVCVYYLCKIKNIPRTLKEILKESHINHKQITQYYNCLVKELNLKLPIHNPIANIPRFITNLGLDFEVEKITIKIIEVYMRNNSIHGANPNGISGGAIYLAAKFKGKKISQKTISDVVGVTDSTLRARYYDIINGINLSILNTKAN
jgi:transcription initiation factor TFIIB